MKRKGIIIAVMCIIAGAVACIGGFAAADWNAAALDSVPSTQKVFNRENYDGDVWYDDVSAVEIRDAKGRVTVKRGATFEVDYSECEYFRYDIEYGRDGFVMQYVELKPYNVYFDLFGAGSRKFRIDVTLPESAPAVSVKTENSSISVDGGTYADLCLQSKNGSVRIEDVAADTIDATTANSSVRVVNCQAAAIRAMTTSGSIRVIDCQTGSVEVETSSASVTVENCAVEGLLKAKTSNGSVHVDDCTATAVDVETTNASVRLNEVEAQTVSAVTANGSIKFDDLDAIDITLRTTNASVKGTLVGSRRSYAVESSTSNGSNNLIDGGDGPRKLSVKTTNGSIKIVFEGI